MSVRDFNGTTDFITFSMGAVSFAYGSMWAIVWTDGSTGAVQNMLTIADTGTNRLNFRITSGLIPSSTWAGTAAAGSTAITAGVWVFIGMSKATGSNTPRFHTYHYSTDTWNHENSATSVGDATTTATAIRMGVNANTTTQWWDGRILASGILNGVVLADSEFESLAHSTALWFGGDGVSWKVALNQASTGTAIRDETGGGGDQSAITGTAIGTESHPMVP